MFSTSELWSSFPGKVVESSTQSELVFVLYETVKVLIQASSMEWPFVITPVNGGKVKVVKVAWLKNGHFSHACHLQIRAQVKLHIGPSPIARARLPT